MPDQSITPAIDTELDGIGHILRDRPLTVPAYQRSYSWRLDQVEAFWADLKAALVLPEPDYFMGTIVLTRGESNRMTIIDGQQRLATATMLLAAVRNAFLAVGDEDRATVIERDYVASRSLRSAELEARLQLNSDDDKFFRDLVVERPGGPPVEPVVSSNRRIAEAFAALAEWLDADVREAGPNWDELLFRWSDLLENRVRVIVVVVPDEADAFLIFETLNDRGLELTIADLLKNYLFGRAGDDLATVKEAWQHAVSALDSAEDQLFTTFLRQYWSSLHGPTRERELYGRLKREIRSKQQAVQFSRDLEGAAPDYAALLNSQHDRWAELTTADHSSVDALLRLGLEQNRPLLLAAMRRFAQGELARLFRSVIAWSVRGLIVGGIGGGTTERYFADAAVAISSGSLSTGDEVFAALAPIVPSDDEFRAAFARASTNRTQAARYYLLALERFTGNADPLACSVSDAEDAQVVLEYLLPRRADPGQWPLFNPDTIGTWAHRIGNMVLLDRTATKGARLPWPEKRARLAASTLATTREAAEVEDWSPDAIVVRQEQFAELAVEIWPREPR